MPFSIRLDPETEATIRRLTRTTGRSKSQVVHEAVAQYASDARASTRSVESAFDRVKPFVGVVRTGGAQYSTDTHAKFRQALQRKRRDRRPR